MSGTQHVAKHTVGLQEPRELSWFFFFFQWHPTLCDPIDGSPPGSSVHGIFQARVLEWCAIAFSVSSLVLSNYEK